jgi:2,4-didehydro-3-deoxy-L-rhamnonate hydrolase
MVTDVNAATGLKKGSFGIGTFASGTSASFPGLVQPDGTVIDLSAQYRDTHAIFDDWERAFDRLVQINAQPIGERHRFADLRPLTPLAHPNLLCAGANYKQHAAEMLTKNKFNQDNRLPGESDEDFFKRNYALMERRALEGMPFIWTGLHSSLTGAQDDVVLPVIGSQPDWELELGVVLGKSERYVTPEQAGRLVAGYLVVNDLGTVDQARRSDTPWKFDWISKHQPTFKPAGPFIVPAAFIELNDDVRIKLKVNGVIKQDWPVTDMIFSIERLLAYASERLRLLPGDLLLTGSPPGNGASHGHFLKPGDVIDSEITYLGHQTNHCVAEVAPGPLTYGPFK